MCFQVIQTCRLIPLQMHLFFAVGVLTFMALPAYTALALWLGGLFVYYSATAFGQPEHTGRREWPAFKDWMGAQLERFLPAWLGAPGRGQGRKRAGLDA